MTTLVIQGPVYDSSFVTKNYQYYSELGYQVIISTWDSNGRYQEGQLSSNVLSHIGNMKYRGNLFHNRNNLLSLESNEDVYTPIPAYYQALSILNGLQSVKKTVNVVKIRTDEYYSNLDVIIRELNEDNQRYISSNTFAREFNDIPFHPSDHIIATKWEYMTSMCTGVVSYYRMNREITGKSVYEYHPPEVVLARAFIHGVDTQDTLDQETLYNKYFKIIPVEELGEYIVKANSRKQTFTNI